MPGGALVDFVLQTVIGGEHVWFWWNRGGLHTSNDGVMATVVRAAQAVDADLRFGNDAYWLLRATYNCVVTLAPTTEFLGPLAQLDENAN